MIKGRSEFYVLLTDAATCRQTGDAVGRWGLAESTVGQQVDQAGRQSVVCQVDRTKLAIVRAGPDGLDRVPVHDHMSVVALTVADPQCGAWGYMEYLEALADPEHERHEDFMEWSGPFGADKFDVAETTEEMQQGLRNWRSL